MKKTLGVIINRVAAVIVSKAAHAGAGTQSLAGWYQPKVPKKIAK